MTSYCVFNVREQRIGIALEHVREIIEPHHVVPTPIPLTPPFVQGLFNLRGQVLPCLDLSTFVGAEEQNSEDRNLASGSLLPASGLRAVIVERGNLRFATLGRRIDTLEADPAKFQPLPGAALHPALEAQAQTEYGTFHVIHLDRLEACLGQTLKSHTHSPLDLSPSPPTPPLTRRVTSEGGTTVGGEGHIFDAPASGEASATQKPTEPR